LFLDREGVKGDEKPEDGRCREVAGDAAGEEYEYAE